MSYDKSAWLEGVNAFRAGVSLTANPYSEPPRYSLLSEQIKLWRHGWENGWQWARAEQSKKEQRCPTKNC